MTAPMTRETLDKIAEGWGYGGRAVRPSETDALIAAARYGLDLRDAVLAWIANEHEMGAIVPEALMRIVEGVGE